ncbi:hypothetical protein B1B04_13030 [Lysinibacillus sp. KCTC 33748]|uniref:hypothetical protein n=1 Tax=unclassified Lysinibacillus TaxID=2636778 RepID=UPI0009A5CA8E|nr:MULTISPECIES: hypothetical protein [unclassified Lysinibacillus]OXS73205.1 hypothetical protein B1B04_13030 [Lysinibacillus sp. KCTC 33748]SKB82570.1 hypothetical protein SAMN06295926_10960 [Lysinibacillus sp. AC-3]
MINVALAMRTKNTKFEQAENIVFMDTNNIIHTYRINHKEYDKGWLLLDILFDNLEAFKKIEWSFENVASVYFESYDNELFGLERLQSFDVVEIVEL